MTPAPSQAPGQRADSLARDLWRTGTWRLMPLLLLYIIGLAIIAPNVPTLMTNFMASRRAGKPMVCEDYLPAKQPQACQNAYSDVVFWSSASSFSPIVGSWSDSVGRKPFLLVATAVGAAPAIVLVLNIRFGVSLFWYYPAQAMGGAVSAISISLAYVADLLMPAHRASAFGTILASFSLGILIGPAIGGMLDPLVASLAASGIGLLCVLYVLFFLPESLSPHAAAECRQRQATSDRSMSNWMGMRILLRTPLFKKLTLCVMISGIASEGVQDLVFQYLKLKLAFTIKDLTLIFEMYGLCGMLVQTIVLRYLLRAVGEVHVLKIGLAAASVQMVAMAFVATKWQAFLSITMGCLGGMSFPAISSIKANNVDVHEQGQIQGALYGARALAVGTGPVIFAAVFAAFSRKDSPLPFFPGAPFLLGAVLMAAAVCVCATIQADAGKGHLAAASDDSESACGGNDDDCDHMAGLSLATSGMASVENAGELMEPLLTRSVKDKTSRDGTVASPMLPDSSYSDL